MKIGKQSLIVTVLILTMFVVTGCEQMTTNLRPRQKFEPSSQFSVPGYARENSIVGSENNSSRGATEAAIEWADKYAKSTQELLIANQRITELDAEKKNLNGKLAKLKTEVESYKNELDDANVMLNEMKKDLKEWQANVLGYRKQMMSAQSAQLLALQKIFELLGGEVGPSEFRIDAENDKEKTPARQITTRLRK